MLTLQLGREDVNAQTVMKPLPYWFRGRVVLDYGYFKAFGVAGLVERARQYQWSSAAAHGLGGDDNLVKVRPPLEVVGKGRWGRFLGKSGGEEQGELLRRHERTGRPLGGERFLSQLESTLGRELRPQKRGPKGPWKHKRAR